MHASNPVSLLDELARCFKTFELLSGRQIRALGLTPPQFEVITALGESGDMHCAALGEITLISKGTLTGVLDRLQQKGWITREPAPADRRSILVRLTPQGQSLYSQLATMPHVHFSPLLTLSARISPKICQPSCDSSGTHWKGMRTSQQSDAQTQQKSSLHIHDTLLMT